MGTAENYFGKHVKRLRAACGISQEELAFQAEVHASYVSQLERGRKSPSLGVILRISRALGTPAGELVGAVEKSMKSGH